MPNRAPHLRRLPALLLLALLASLLAAAPTAAQEAPTELFLSEYVEGSSNNKALEIANPTGSSVDLAAGGYSIQMLFNGSTTPGLTIQLTGTVAAGDVFVLAQSSANAAILAQADQTSGGGWFNGDDAVVLRRGTTTIDVIGQIGFDPGTEWGSGLTSTADNTLRRKAGICAGDPDGTDPFDPAVQWDGFASDTVDGLGVHTGCGGDGGDPDPDPEPDPDPQPAVTPISAVQGRGPASPLVGQVVTVEATVTARFEFADAPDGVFVQEQDADADGDPATSEGLYVFCRGACPALSVGDVVAVTGLVTEFFGMTQITAQRAGDIRTVATGQPLPTATPITLPAAGPTTAPQTFEAVEGMVITVPQTLTVAEHFELARYGQVVLHAGERPLQFTQAQRPDPARYAAFLADLSTRRIILDDDSNTQNDPVTGPVDEPYPYPTAVWPPDQPDEGLSVTNRFRSGDTTTGLTGVMHWSFAGQPGTDAWRIRPIDGLPYTFEPTNPRPAAPAEVGGDLRVASFNVLNYFPTIDTTSSGSSGPCGPSGTQDCRGADSQQELDRQRAKIVAALVAIDAAVVGLIEIENSPTAVQDLVDQLNAAVGEARYAQVDTGAIGTDAIKVGLIYQPALVEPVGDHAVLDATVDPRFRDDRNRPTLAQTFRATADGGVFTAAVNHLKSKGSACSDVEDETVLDGQGSCSETRAQATRAMVDWLAGDPTGSGDPDVLVLGDLNAYRQEDVLVILREAGYVDLEERFEGPASYSYLFDGQLGTLDYALASASLAPQATGATAWHVNADEVPLLDYNDEVRDIGESSFERESAARPLFAPDPYRSSDHDPLVVGLALAAPPVADVGGPYEVRVGNRTVVLDATASADPDGDALTYAWDLDGDGAFDDATGPTAEFSSRGRPPGTYPVAVRVTDAVGFTSTDATTVDVVTAGNDGRPPGRYSRGER